MSVESPEALERSVLESKDREQRPRQVELLLDAQRPEVEQRGGRRALIEVAVRARREAPHVRVRHHQ